MRFFALVATVVLVVSSQALAWHEGGHKIVASIAFRQLSADGKSAVVALLKKHPRFQEEFDGKMPDDLDEASTKEWIIQQAAIFPDLARSYRGELNKQYHHPMWHFINMPEFLSNADRMELHPEHDLNLSLDAPPSLDRDSNVVQVIRVARRTIADKHTPAAERALMLSWLIHTVGDLHQPLHSTALFSRGMFPKGDRGGNSIGTVQKANLHSLWDDFPGGKLKFAIVRSRAVKLSTDPSLKTLGNTAAEDLNEETWLKESQALAVNAVYDSEVMVELRHLEKVHQDTEDQPLDLSEDYLRTGADTAEKRVVQAGFRLGAILSELFE